MTVDVILTQLSVVDEGLKVGDTVTRDDLIGLAGLAEEQPVVGVQMTVGGEPEAMVLTRDRLTAADQTPLEQLKLAVIEALAQDFGLLADAEPLDQQAARLREAVADQEVKLKKYERRLQEWDQIKIGMAAERFEKELSSTFGFLASTAEAYAPSWDEFVAKIDELRKKGPGTTLSLGIAYPSAPGHALLPVPLGNTGAFAYLAVENDKLGYYMNMLNIFIGAKDIATKAGLNFALSAIGIADAGLSLVNDIRLSGTDGGTTISTKRSPLSLIVKTNEYISASNDAPLPPAGLHPGHLAE